MWKKTQYKKKKDSLSCKSWEKRSCSIMEEGEGTLGRVRLGAGRCG